MPQTGGVAGRVRGRVAKTLTGRRRRSQSQSELKLKPEPHAMHIKRRLSRTHACFSSHATCLAGVPSPPSSLATCHMLLLLLLHSHHNNAFSRSAAEELISIFSRRHKSCKCAPFCLSMCVPVCVCVPWCCVIKG